MTIHFQIFNGWFAMKRVSMIIGLVVAVLGLLNVMPTYGVLPRIGPFELSMFRPGIYFLCVLSMAAVLWQKEHYNFYRYLLIPVVAFSAYAGWDSYIVGVELEESVFFFGAREMWIASGAVMVALYLSWRVWGAPIAILGGVTAFYLVTGEYWPGMLQTSKADMAELIAGNFWYSIDLGILGGILGVVSTTVLPFIILGAVLEGVGAGGSMIRIAFYYMSRFRGGPAYAAVSSSALFGSVSGSAVANVVGTGVVTIPMIRKRGFTPEFSGGVEAAASSGGQILPPIMGAAALVMADIVGVSYVTVMAAAIIPALAYYVSLFLTINFEAQRLGVHQAEDEEVIKPTKQDWMNLSLVFGPIAIIVYLLVTGMSPSGASITAILLLFPMSFLNPEVRKQPFKLVQALSTGGNTIARLLGVTGIVGVVVAVLSATGLPSKLSVLLMDAASTSMFIALAISAVGCIILGMGMPTLPAYIAIISVMGATLQSMGLELLTAHMFVFTFGVASVITPPVAIASYAAAAIADGKPIRTAFESSRIGIMIFLIPFAFVYNPALTMGAGTMSYGLTEVAVAILFLFGAMYMIASSLAGYDRIKLTTVERLLAFALGLALIFGDTSLQTIALLVAVVLVARRFTSAYRPRMTA